MDPLILILSDPKLTIRDIRTLALTNKDWEKAARDEMLWIRLYFKKLVGVMRLDKLEPTKRDEYIGSLLETTTEGVLWTAMRKKIRRSMDNQFGEDGTRKNQSINGYHVFMSFTFRAILLGLRPQAGFFDTVFSNTKKLWFKGILEATPSEYDEGGYDEVNITIENVDNFENARNIRISVPSRYAEYFEGRYDYFLRPHSKRTNRPFYDATRDTYSEDTHYQVTPDGILFFLYGLLNWQWQPLIKGRLSLLENCAQCGKEAFEQCGAQCGKAFYCGQECANTHWEKGHEKECK